MNRVAFRHEADKGDGRMRLTTVAALCMALMACASEADDPGLAATSVETTEQQTTTTTSSTTTAPTTTTTSAPPEQPIVLSGTGQQQTDPFRLEGDRYAVHYRFDGECFYGATLQSTSGGLVYEDLGTGMGPVEGDTNIYGIGASEFYADVITGPAPDCPWEITIARAE
jgi:hypothetical protein